MLLPRATLLHVLAHYGIEADCSTPTADGRLFCTLIGDDVVESQWLTDPVSGLLVRYLARRFDIPTHAFYFDLEQDTGPPSTH